MTNIEFADVLERLAAKYRADETLPQVSLLTSRHTKEDLAAAIRGFGGRWKKSGMEDDSEYASLYFDSVQFAPLRLYIPRYSVCRKTVTYECDPIMSPEEEAEVLA